MNADIHKYSSHLNAAYFLVDENALRHKNRPAIICGESQILYGELQKLVNKFGNGLKRLGIRPGERVLCRFPNVPEAAIAFLAAMKMGAIPVVSFPFLKESETQKMVNGSDSVAVITMAEGIKEVEAIKPGCPQLQHIITVGQSFGSISFDELLQEGSEYLEPVDTLKEDVAFLCYTSGSTSDPKGLPHTHGNILVDAYSYVSYCLEAGPGDVFYSPLPIAFAFGLAALLFYPLRPGAAVVYMPKRVGPEEDLEILERHQVTHLHCTAQRLQAILSVKDAEKRFNLSRLRVVATGSSVVSVELFEEWRKRFGTTIQPYYGLSEIIGPALGFRYGEGRGGTIGRLLPGWEAKVVDDKGCEVADGQSGALLIRGPNLIGYYWKDQVSTAKFLKDGWLDTRDLVTRDESGFFYYQGRADDQIKSAGWTISPWEIEEVMQRHPAVAEAVVVSMPDKVKWAVPVAFVVASREYHPSLELEEKLKRFIRGELAGYKCPREIRFLPRLPKSATGKVLRRELQKMTAG